jgi:hypothetical protein
VPLVKGYSTEMSLEVTRLGVQVHGGMGFIEETGAAQHLRDARITAIYEGTTAIQAADLIGQLGDPMYSRKANALFYEFEEIGMSRQLGYSSPADLIDKFPAFFWNSVSMHLDEGVKFLNLTVSGRQWIANMHHHILCAEHAHRLMGPQR